jgi:prevent-host-death family protein
MNRTMKASEFKAKCLAVMDQVAKTGHSVVLTKNGKPVAELKPYQASKKKNLFGIWKGQVEITGDILSPVDIEWDAMK